MTIRLTSFWKKLVRHYFQSEAGWFDQIQLFNGGYKSSLARRSFSLMNDITREALFLDKTLSKFSWFWFILLKLSLATSGCAKISIGDRKNKLNKATIKSWHIAQVILLLSYIPIITNS